MGNIKVSMITTRHLPGDPRIFEKEAHSLKKFLFEVDIIIPEGTIPKDTYGIQFLFFKKATKPFRKISTIINTYKKSKESAGLVYHCHEIDVSLWIGYLLKKINKKKNIKLIFDAHEFWLGFFSERIIRPFRGLFKLFFIFYEKFILKECDYIITANSIERSYYQILFPKKQISVIYNVPHLVDSDFEMNGTKIYDLCYEGFLNFERGAKVLFEIVKMLKGRYKDEVKLLILGEINENKCKSWATEFIEKNNLDNNIIFPGWQSYHDLYKYHRLSKIGIFLYQYTPTHLLSGPPNKLFNFMKAGIPIIATDLPETLNILEETKCGFAVKPNNPTQIYHYLEKLLLNPELCQKLGRNGYAAFKTKYNWNKEEENLKIIYEKLLFIDE